MAQGAAEILNISADDEHNGLALILNDEEREEARAEMDVGRIVRSMYRVEKNKKSLPRKSLYVNLYLK